MKKTAFIIMVLTIISKISGFARDITLSYFYGASNISDAYLISTTIPIVIFSFIGTGISTGYIPMYSKIEQYDGIDEGNRFTNNLFNMLIIMCTVIVIFGLLFTDQIVKVFASGFEADTLKLTVQFTRISLLGIYFTGSAYLFGGFLQLKGNYIIPALVGLPLNLFIILSIIISSNTSIIVLSVGSVVAAASEIILLLPFILKKGYRYKFIIDIKDRHIKNMANIVLPIIVGVSVSQINVLVDRTIASQVAIGGISALNYANKLNGFVQGIFVLSIATVLYPTMSKLAAENNISSLKRSLSEAIAGINILVVPATIGSMIFAEPIVRLLFGRGAFDSNAISMTSYALFYYSIGMIGYGLREVVSRVFYALQDMKTPMVNAAIAVVMNIILNIILSRFLGIGGLALATSISAIFCTALLFISIRKKIGAFGMKDMSISFVKILCASMIMGAIAKLSYYTLTKYFSVNLSLLVSVGVGAIVYFTIIYFMKIEDVDIIVNTLKRRMKRNVG